MLYRYLYPLAKIYWWIFRPISFGVRLLLVNNEKILLVKHTYLPGWMLPGGTVNYEENFAEAVKREVKEELNIAINNVSLFGIYKSRIEGKRDHIIVFVSQDQIIENQIIIEKQEILEWRLFDLKKLPSDISPGHLKRIKEYIGKQYPNTSSW